MADDDEIRKIIQATGGGEYNARLGEYRVSHSASFIPFAHYGCLALEGCVPHMPCFCHLGSVPVNSFGCVDRRVQY